MAMKLSQTDLRKAATRAESLKTRLAGLRKRTEKVAERAVHTAEVGATAFAFGVLQGKTGGIEVVGVPLELGTGVGLHLMGYLGLGGKMSDHLHGIADGALAAYLTTIGRAVGAEWKKKGSGTGELEDGHRAARIGQGANAFRDDELKRAVVDAVAVEG